jgi:hypothetical protein
MIPGLYNLPGNRREKKTQKYNLCEYTLMYALLSMIEAFAFLSDELPHPIR